MEPPIPSRLRIGEWLVDPALGTMKRNGDTVRVDVRSMRLLICLAEPAGQVVSIDELISKVWAGVAVSPDSVYQAVTALRRQLGDDSRQPAYIETVPRLGYRMIASVAPWDESATAQSAPISPIRPTESGANVSRRARGFTWTAIAVALVIALAYLVHARFSAGNKTGSSAVPPTLSVGVLPLLDLTEGMRNEEFADGLTEELIDKLSKIPGIGVPSATSAFYYKGKALPVSQIARELNVVYLLDGSVRKSGGTVRIAMRLMRADNSYVIWTETYDRPISDLFVVQDDIAGQVAKALNSSLGTSSSPTDTLSR